MVIVVQHDICSKNINLDNFHQLECTANNYFRWSKYHSYIHCNINPAEEKSLLIHIQGLGDNRLTEFICGEYRFKYHSIYNKQDIIHIPLHSSTIEIIAECFTPRSEFRNLGIKIDKIELVDRISNDFGLYDNITLNKLCYNIDIPLLKQHPNIYCITDRARDGIYYNSAIFTFKNDTYILFRRIRFGNSILSLSKLNLNTLSLENIPIQLINDIYDEQYDDPRVLVFNNLIYISCSTYSKKIKSNPHIKIIVLNDNFQHINTIHPIYDGNSEFVAYNTKPQKNWTWFINNSKIYSIYSINPHKVVMYINNLPNIEYTTHNSIYDKWKYGEIRGGSNPILIDDKYYSFFHSSVIYKGSIKQYLMGCYTFSDSPPFEILSITKEPILWGSNKDSTIFSTLTVFPCGAIYQNENFYISFGHMEQDTKLIRMPINEIKRRLY